MTMNTNTKRICRFLVATEGTHHFLSASTLYIPYQDYLYLKNNINSFRNNTDDRKWQAILINDTEYLIKVVHYKEKNDYGGYLCWRYSDATSETEYWKEWTYFAERTENLSSSTHLIEADSERTQTAIDIT